MDLQSVKQKLGIIGTNEAFDRAIEVALRVAPTDLSVLVTGESGVGKEFFPQIIHSYSARKHNAYIAVNCGAIPQGTIDSELFGHEKGSFTGATGERKGYFEQADGGTIFLDEVAELPLTTQVRLLRVLQAGEFIRVGSSKSLKTNVRVVAATNINLINAIAAGRFREDLFYRLNTVPITVPPLRERREDIFLLFKRFATDIATQYRMPIITLTEPARRMLENYRWPGNTRQLKNVAEQISAIETSREINDIVLAKYLPDYNNSNLPMISGGGPNGKGDTNVERDILYKLLFDLRDEVTQLRTMISEGSQSTSKPFSAITVRQPMDNVDDFVPAEDVSDKPVSLTRDDILRAQIETALVKHRGHRRAAAEELFMSERTLYRKIKELGIE